MKINPNKLKKSRRTTDITRPFSLGGLLALQAVCIGLGFGIATSQDEAFKDDVAGAEVLTRGPVHEAFAGIVSFNPEPGIIVESAPPAVIEEIPPSERPEGDNVAWVPGYWAWDDERSDFLWVSGMWRALPPGREWIFGYWADIQQGYQWTSGYWADSAAEETVYLPEPPKTLERGPNIAAPSPDYGWSPGAWVWNQERYAWGPGYWALGRPDWEWMPSHYVWTPRGHIYVNGYWDYAVDRRGVLFAPVYFNREVYSQRGYRYAPSIALNLVGVIEHLFLRPNYHHYYFGDYYAPRYQDSGFFSPFGYQSTRYGYDTIFSHRRWEHRNDRDWERRIEASYHDRRDHESNRPPHTWADQRKFKSDPKDSKEHQTAMATPFEQLAQEGDNPSRFQAVEEKERQEIAERGQDLKKYRDDRQTRESKDSKADDRGPNERPFKVQTPKSPIVGKKSDELSKEQSPPESRQEPIAVPGVSTKTQTPEGRPSAETPKGKPQTPNQPLPDKSQKKVEKLEKVGKEPDQTPPLGRESNPMPSQPAEQPAELPPTRSNPQPQKRPQPTLGNSREKAEPIPAPDQTSPRGPKSDRMPKQPEEPQSVKQNSKPQPRPQPAPEPPRQTEKPKSGPDKGTSREKEKAPEPKPSGDGGRGKSGEDKNEKNDNKDKKDGRGN